MPWLLRLNRLANNDRRINGLASQIYGFALRAPKPKPHLLVVRVNRQEIAKRRVSVTPPRSIRSAIFSSIRISNLLNLESKMSRRRAALTVYPSAFVSHAPVAYHSVIQESTLSFLEKPRYLGPAVQRPRLECSRRLVFRVNLRQGVHWLHVAPAPSFPVGPIPVPDRMPAPVETPTR